MRATIYSPQPKYINPHASPNPRDKSYPHASPNPRDYINPHGFVAKAGRSMRGEELSICIKYSRPHASPLQLTNATDLISLPLIC
jgi:hypothetical protein